MRLAIDYAANPARIGDDLAELERIGRGEGTGRGVSRLAFTAGENRAHDHIRKQMEAAGMATRTDGVGNLYGLLNSSGGRKIVVGSHLDTVEEGGNYDGALGVVMGVEAARVLALNRSDINLEAVAFRAEEAARFGFGCIGSKLVTGALGLDKAGQSRDANGTALYDAMKSCGFSPEKTQLLDKDRIRLYIEPHIEQGQVLLEAGVPVGVVTGIAAPVRYRATVTGRQDHSGTTPMNKRRDALAAFSEMHLTLESLAKECENSGNHLRATIGYVQVPAGSINKVAGEVQFLIDIRSQSTLTRTQFEDFTIAKLHEIGAKRGVGLRLEELERGMPVMLREEDYGIIENATKRLGVQTMRLPSGAGHDAQYVALAGIPTAMLFIQNRGGSHNPEESVDMGNVVLATNVLIRAIIEADKR